MIDPRELFSIRPSAFGPDDGGGPPPEQQAPSEADIAAARYFTELMRRTPRVLVTPALVAVNAAVFVMMLISGVDIMSPTIEQLLEWGANYAPLISGGETWRLLASNYIHIGIIHVAFNMAVLWQAGQLVERMLGNAGFLIVYTVSGLLGSMASVMWNPDVVSAGASGAVFGVYGFLIAHLTLNRGRIPVGVVSSIRNSALAFLAFNVMFSLSVDGIDMAAHIGGLLGGAACGALLHLPGLWARRPMGDGLVALAGALALTWFVGVGMTPSADLQGALQRFGEVEQQVFERYNDAMEQVQAQALSDPEFGVVIDTEVLPPWRQARETFEATPDVSEAQRPRFELLVRYMQLREEAWTILSQAVRAGDPVLAEGFGSKMGEAEAVLVELENTD